MMHLFLSGVSLLPLFSGISYSFHEHLKPLLRRAMRIPQATHACLVLFGECWHVPHFGKILLLQLPDFWSGISRVLEILAVIIILAVVPLIVRYLSLFSNPIYSHMSGFEQSGWGLQALLCVFYRQQCTVQCWGSHFWITPQLDCLITAVCPIFHWRKTGLQDLPSVALSTSQRSQKLETENY